MSKKRGNRKRRPRRQSSKTPGWHLKLEEFRREAQKKSPEVVTRSDVRGWELHLSYKPGHHACPECPWQGLRVTPLESDIALLCPDCGTEVLLEPWTLVAHPCRENNDYTWLGKAAEFLGAPPEDKPEKPAKGGKAMVTFSWAERVAVSPLEGI